MAVNNRVKITNDIELKDRLVAINRVTKVTKGGRTFTFSAIVVVGNEDGIIGWGLGKAGEVTAAIAKGVESAKKNLTRVPVLKGTVPHEQSAKFGGAEVFIKPASTGTGVVAGGAMRAVLESVGVTDVLAKSKGSSNPHNLVKATILALSEMRDARMVAQNRGVESAKKNLTRVPVLKGTVPHEQSAKFGGAEVFIKPASTGTGVVAGGAMRAVLESVGVTDVLAKSKGSSNPHNLVKATILALSEMRDARMVAQNRGVSLEKVFRG